ncbi:MAG TPA: hypothetical protein VFC92_09940, partial [Bacteroidales bacterium]|nr:hypothetical protein [Bacteroidales bacterium]
MEKRFQNLPIFDLQSKLPNDGASLSYLLELKWDVGFSCLKCGNNKYFTNRMKSIDWLCELHHRVDSLQKYINEYCYRFSWGAMSGGFFYNLSKRMVKGKPFPYKVHCLL